MKWPNDPKDFKELLIGLISGLLVAVVVLLKDALEVFWPESKNTLTIGLLVMLIFFMFYFIDMYHGINDNLDSIAIQGKRQKNLNRRR